MLRIMLLNNWIFREYEGYIRFVATEYYTITCLIFSFFFFSPFVMLANELFTRKVVFTADFYEPAQNTPGDKCYICKQRQREPCLSSKN